MYMIFMMICLINMFSKMSPFKLSLNVTFVSIMLSFKFYEFSNSIFFSSMLIIIFSSGMMIMFSYCSLMMNHEEKNKNSTSTKFLLMGVFVGLVFLMSFYGLTSNFYQTLNYSKMLINEKMIFLLMMMIILSLFSINLNISKNKTINESY